MFELSKGAIRVYRSFFGFLGVLSFDGIIDPFVIHIAQRICCSGFPIPYVPDFIGAVGVHSVAVAEHCTSSYVESVYGVCYVPGKSDSILMSVSNPCCSVILPHVLFNAFCGIIPGGEKVDVVFIVQGLKGDCGFSYASILNCYDKLCSLFPVFL